MKMFEDYNVAENEQEDFASKLFNSIRNTNNNTGATKSSPLPYSEIVDFNPKNYNIPVKGKYKIIDMPQYNSPSGVWQQLGENKQNTREENSNNYIDVFENKEYNNSNKWQTLANSNNSEPTYQGAENEKYNGLKSLSNDSDYDTIKQKANMQVADENLIYNYPDWAKKQLVELKIRWMIADKCDDQQGKIDTKETAKAIRDKVDKINSMEDSRLRSVINNLSERYYNAKTDEERGIIASYGEGFWQKYDEINSLPYQHQKDRLTKDTLDWYLADGYIYSNDNFAMGKDSNNMQKATDDAEDLRNSIKQQNEYFNSLPDWARSIAQDFSQKYNDSYIAGKQEGMDSATYWGGQFRDKMKEIEKMTSENKANGEQLAWYTNMYFNHPQWHKKGAEGWAEDAKLLREKHAQEIEETAKAKVVILTDRIKTNYNDIPPADDGWTRTDLVNMAKTYLGEPYFWGGKYAKLGQNPNWGKWTKVTAEGSRTSRHNVPLGLDCSGFVQWVYSQMLIPQGKNFPWASTYEQRKNSLAISKDDLKPGDLAFTGNCDHVGIYIGKDSNGNNLYIHSAGSEEYASKDQPGGRCLISTYSGFTDFRRVDVKFKDVN